jgi:hypothetical protein
MQPPNRIVKFSLTQPIDLVSKEVVISKGSVHPQFVGYQKL